jgi:hypothetical protein
MTTLPIPLYPWIFYSLLWLGTDKLKSNNNYTKNYFDENNNFYIFVSMKKIYLFLLLFVINLWSYSQSMPLKSYCFGNPKHNLLNQLSPESKIELEKILMKNNIDTSSVYRIQYDDIFTTYASKKYLSNHSYTYINWFKLDGVSNVREYVNMNGYNPQKPDKLIILYSTNHDNTEYLSVYILN